MEFMEVVAPDEVDPEVLETQQRFVALEFPARFGSKVMKHLSTNFQPLTELGVEEAAALPPIEDVEKENMKKHLKTAVEIGDKLKEERQKTLSCAWGCVVVDPAVDGQVATSEVSGELQTKYKFETLYHPVMVAVDGVAERDRRREVEVDETARKKQKCVKGDESRPALKEEECNGELTQSESYLCTGYDVYLDREPCAMCAMALVHSRARRVVFDRANPDDGVLMSSFKLHTIKSLNHHYRVFQLSLTSEEKTA
ncbi:Cytosine deaminase [Phytophthora palmivora]|uniref:Cytosine deaminase n=1 Tax=Phytophthora palmivora TaxID=4796 RepID=A0A2P4Y4A0_9STRA|nr:Cytosine deaminase [Phytophthora palmivora]